jgi:hypothetical protein
VPFREYSRQQGSMSFIVGNAPQAHTQGNDLSTLTYDDGNPRTVLSELMSSSQCHTCGLEIKRHVCWSCLTSQRRHVNQLHRHNSAQTKHNAFSDFGELCSTQAVSMTSSSRGALRTSSSRCSSYRVGTASISFLI